MESKQKQIYIFKEAGVDVNSKAEEGVVYKDKKKKYWVDRQKRDCFEIYAKGLNITLGDRPVYWQWKTDGNNEGIERAELVKTRWLEVKGSFWTTGYLTHGSWYKVSFLVRLPRDSNMKKQIVNLRLTRPDGSIQAGQAALPDEVDTEKWHELEVGRFYMNERNAGEMLFAMEQSFNRWMKGLFIKSVEIKAVDN